MLKTRQRRSGSAVLPNCEDLTAESGRALVHNEISINVSGAISCVLLLSSSYEIEVYFAE